MFYPQPMTNVKSIRLLYSLTHLRPQRVSNRGEGRWFAQLKIGTGMRLLLTPRKGKKKKKALLRTTSKQEETYKVRFGLHNIEKSGYF